MRQLEESALEIATLTAERDSARQQSTVNAPAPTNAPAQSEEPIVISSGTPTQNDSVGQRSGVASQGVAHSMPGMERNRVTPSPQEPRKACRHVEFAVTSGEYAITTPMPLKPHRSPCFDPSQRGGPTVKSWVFTMNVFFDANYVESDAAKIRYAVSLLRGPAMDWCRVIVTSPRAYKPPSQEYGPTGPAVTWTCYPTSPPVGPAVAAAFAPAVWGEGGELGVVAVSGGDGGAAVEPCCAAALAAARSCSPGGLPPYAPASAVPPHTPSSTASTLAEGLVKLNLLPLHRLSLLLPAVAVFSALGVPLQEEYYTWF
ncbi:unnamed protein product [Closterium sp. NIES-54]